MALSLQGVKLGFRLGLYDSGHEDLVKLIDPLFSPTKLDTLAMQLCIADFKKRKSGRRIGIFIVEEEDEGLDPGEGGS